MPSTTVSRTHVANSRAYEAAHLHNSYIDLLLLDLAALWKVPEPPSPFKRTFKLKYSLSLIERNSLASSIHALTQAKYRIRSVQFRGRRLIIKLAK